MAAQRPYRQRKQYLTPTAWELSRFLAELSEELPNLGIILQNPV